MITPRIKLISRAAASMLTSRPARRPRRGAGLRVETLEGRALMATAALDPTFGQAGFVTGLLDTGTQLNDDDAAAVAVDANGKTVVAGYAGFGGTAKFTVRRFNADGSLDTTFGTNGETDPPLPGTSNPGYTDPVELSIGLNGSIALVTRSFGSPTTSTVVKLTPGGQLDTTFGTNGEYSLADGDGLINDLYSVAVQPDGKIVATGIHYNGSTTALSQLLAIRLTATGTLDTSFAGTGIQILTVPGVSPTNMANSGTSLLGSSLAVAPSGQIYLGTNMFRPSNTGIVANTNGEIARLNADGTLDTSFATSGYLTLPSNVTNTLNAIAVQSDNKLVIAGKISSTSPTNPAVALPTTPFLIRYLTTGAVDPTFRAIPISAASTQTGLREVFTSLAIGTDGTITAGGYRLTTYYGSGTPNESNPQLIAAQFTTTGQVNTAFGVHGQMTVTDPAYPNTGLDTNVVKVALTPSNDVVLLGRIYGSSYEELGTLARLTPTLVLNNATNDFDGDGKSDIAAELTNAAFYAYRRSNGTGDVLQQFGQAGVGASIPVTGDFDGDGKPDVAVYLPALGALAYRPSNGTSDVIDFFGPKGIGAAIPAPGDYDGDGRTDFAVYIPTQGRFAVQPTGGGPNYYASFGAAGVGQSIPVPGDYDGDGRTDLAVYVPMQGALYYRPTGGGPDVKVAFGPAGIGASIPAPGDYDGDGKTDLALYIPATGRFAIHPSSGVANYYVPFGAAGAGYSIPAPGDYDGDGKTDAAVYLPTLGEFAYLSSSTGQDMVQGFGTLGFGKTIPATANVYAQVLAAPTLYPQGATGSTATAAILIPLTDDLIAPATAKKKTTTMLS